MMETILERWAEQGFQQGFERGVQQGLEQGLERGAQRGIRQGLLTGIELGLELKFGATGLRLLPEIYKIEDVDVLRAVHSGIRTSATPAELRLIYRQNGDNGAGPSDK